MEEGPTAQRMQAVSGRWRSQKQPSCLWLGAGEHSKGALGHVELCESCGTEGDIRKEEGDNVIKIKGQQGRTEGQ